MAERRSLAAVARRAVGAAKAVGATVSRGRQQAADPEQGAEKAAVPTKKTTAATKKTTAPTKKTTAATKKTTAATKKTTAATKKTTAATKKTTAATKKTTAPTRKTTAATTKPAVPAVLAVRAEEDPWTVAELDGVRQELIGELERITRDMAALESSIADVLRDSGDGAGDDQADTGSKAFEREQEMTLLANTRETQFQIERALQAIADGSYGRCESCGNPIGKARLQAFPRATLCVACKQRQERR